MENRSIEKKKEDKCRRSNTHPKLERRKEERKVKKKEKLKYRDFQR